MQTFRTESNYRSAARLTAPELRAAQQRGEDPAKHRTGL